MTEKTMRKISNMKTDYNFGVEVEMNHISREKAAKIAADLFGTGHYQYSGTYYDTWTAYDAQGREWKFMTDSSIAGGRGEQCEMATPVLEYSDIAVLQDLLRALRKAGAVSNPSQGCGVHIHVSRKQGFTVQGLKNLVKLMAAHEMQICKGINVSEGRIGSYCQPTNRYFLESMKNCRSFDGLERKWYDAHGTWSSRFHHYNHSRYHMLNLHSFFHGHGTVEFRLWQFENPHGDKKGGLHAGQMKAMIQMSLMMCEHAHSVRSTSAVARTHADEKTAMRSWMYRLGFVGEEFETARDFFVKGFATEAGAVEQAS